MDWIVGLIVSWVLAAVVLLIVDRLHIGLEVGGFGSALIAALVIAMFSLVTIPIVRLLQAPFEGLIAWLIGWVFSAILLYVISKLLRGFKIINFPAALVVALVLGILAWLADWVQTLV